MNAADVVASLGKKGVLRTESSIKYLATKYDLYLPKTESPRPGLDPKKISVLVGALTSPLRVAEIARQADVSYSKVKYHIMKNNVRTENVYGTIVLKNKKDLDYVKSFL